MRSARIAAVLVLTTAAALVGGACSGDEEAGPTTREDGTTTTTAAPPSTVSDADFDSAAGSATEALDAAGTDPCAVSRAIGSIGALPAPANPGQAERGVRTVARLFEVMAAAPPQGSEADVATLRDAGPALVAEGEQRGWDPTWLSEGAGPAALSPAVQGALENYARNAAQQCGGTGAPGAAPPG